MIKVVFRNVSQGCLQADDCIVFKNHEIFPQKWKVCVLIMLAFIQILIKSGNSTQKEYLRKSGFWNIKTWGQSPSNEKCVVL